MAVTDFAAAIAAHPQFRVPRLVNAASFDLASLTPAQQRIFARVAGAHASYFQRNPRFEDANLRRLTGLESPQVGPEWFARLIGFAITGGLLPSAHPDNAVQAARARPVPTAARP